MDSKKVIWTSTAQKQLYQVLDYWTNRNQSKEYALRLLDKNENRIQLISIYPEAFKEIDFQGIRRSILDHYSILFQAHEDRILIVGF